MSEIKQALKYYIDRIYQCRLEAFNYPSRHKIFVLNVCTDAALDEFSKRLISIDWRSTSLLTDTQSIDPTVVGHIPGR